MTGPLTSLFTRVESCLKRRSWEAIFGPVTTKLAGTIIFPRVISYSLEDDEMAKLTRYLCFLGDLQMPSHLLMCLHLLRSKLTACCQSIHLRVYQGRTWILLSVSDQHFSKKSCLSRVHSGDSTPPRSGSNNKGLPCSCL